MSFSAFPALDAGDLEAAILMDSPVAGVPSFPGRTFLDDEGSETKEGYPVSPGQRIGDFNEHSINGDICVLFAETFGGDGGNEFRPVHNDILSAIQAMRFEIP